MALFRPNNLVQHTFSVDGEDIPTEAPLVARPVAIRQLSEALPYFNQLFSKEGKLDEYAAFLGEALAAVDFKFVTVELQEIACLQETEQAFYDYFREALAGIGSDFSAEAKERFMNIANFRETSEEEETFGILRRFPPARLLLDNLEAPDDDYWNHCRVCGAGRDNAGIGRAVPWETV
jgi:hypothetical protein